MIYKSLFWNTTLQKFSVWESHDDLMFILQGVHALIEKHGAGNVRIEFER